jgi:hypothetical protein
MHFNIFATIPILDKCISFMLHFARLFKQIISCIVRYGTTVYSCSSKGNTYMAGRVLHRLSNINFVQAYAHEDARPLHTNEHTHRYKLANMPERCNGRNISLHIS